MDHRDLDLRQVRESGMIGEQLEIERSLIAGVNSVNPIPVDDTYRERMEISETAGIAQG